MMAVLLLISFHITASSVKKENFRVFLTSFQDTIPIQKLITSGGTKLNSSEDFLTPWLKFILNFFGIEKVEVISADQMALDYEKSIKEAEKQIENII